MGCIGQSRNDEADRFELSLVVPGQRPKRFYEFVAYLRSKEPDVIYKPLAIVRLAKSEWAKAFIIGLSPSIIAKYYF